MGPSTVTPVATLVIEQVITRSSGIRPWKRPIGATTTGVPTATAEGPDGDVARNGSISGQLMRKVYVEFCEVCDALAAAAVPALASADTMAAAKMITMRLM